MELSSPSHLLSVHEFHYNKYLLIHTQRTFNLRCCRRRLRHSWIMSRKTIMTHLHFSVRVIQETVSFVQGRNNHFVSLSPYVI